MARPWRWIAIALGALLLGFASGAIALAETQSVTATLEASEDTSFRSLLQRAEAAAAGLVTRTFAAHPEATDVSVQIGADRYGKVSPIFAVAVSRQDWQANPNVQTWAQYLPAAAVLLGFREAGPRSVAAAPVASRSGNPSNPDNEPNFYQ